MKKTIAYGVLTDATLDKLRIQVNAAIADGWEPLGGISGASQAYGSAMTFMQAIVKYAPE
ncbi:MAG TPA: DUF1737 domain-containing protein [Candidatus Acidoferrum sp.]|nr:DUF1737 domain-containing protein [Candidatus Acidoferrum sp.]